jgi:hypothetical protein
MPLSYLCGFPIVVIGPSGDTECDHSRFETIYFLWDGWPSLKVVPLLGFLGVVRPLLENRDKLLQPTNNFEIFFST